MEGVLAPSECHHPLCFGHLADNGFFEAESEGTKIRDLFIMQKRDTSCYLKDVDDSRPLSDLCLPGVCIA